MHAIARTTAAVSAVLLIISAPPAAYAGQNIHDDAAADVVQIVPGGDPIPVPEQQDGDITRLVVDHLDTKVIIKATYTALHHPEFDAYHFGSLVTNDSLRRDVAIFDVTASSPQGRKRLLKTNGNPVACGGLDRQIDYSADTVKIKIPRSCLGNPRWVKVGFGTVWNVEVKSETVTYVDDALLDGDFGDAHPAFGPKVFRG